MKGKKPMELINLVLGELATNCYILDIGNGEAVAFDIGNGAKKVMQALEVYHLQGGFYEFSE